MGFVSDLLGGGKQAAPPTIMAPPTLDSAAMQAEADAKATEEAKNRRLRQATQGRTSTQLLSFDSGDAAVNTQKQTLLGGN